MSSIYTERGTKKRITTLTKGDVILKVNSSIYKDDFMKVDKPAKNIMLAILKYMTTDTNLITIGSDTLNAICSHTGYKPQVIRNNLRKLYPMIEKTTLRGEYIVNPVFAVKGDEAAVWNIYKQIEADRQIKYNINKEG